MATRRDHALWARRLWRRTTITAAVVFLLLWSSSMVVALAGAGCDDLRRDEDRRLRLCNVSVAVRPFSLARSEAHKAAAIDLERALIRADRGELTGARSDMQGALDAASFGEPSRALARLRRHDPATDLRPQLSFLAGLQAQIDHPETSAEARALWAAVAAQAR